MKPRLNVLCALLISTVVMPGLVMAQTPQTGSVSGVAQAGPGGPPRVISMAGSLVDASGQPMAGSASLVFGLYAEEKDGLPLWTEIQTVQADEKGRYTVRLGSVTPLPIEAFQTTEARWLSVQAAGGSELPRMRLLSVPYALKAADAETLGGLPASAFLPASGAAGTGATGALNQWQGTGPKPMTVTDARGNQDVVVADDQIVVGRLCVGFNCANLEAFGTEDVKVKATFDPTIKLEQTGAPAQNWFMVGDEFGFAINESGGLGSGPFVIRPLAPAGSLFVNAAGNVGIGTTIPAQKLDVRTTAGSAFANIFAPTFGNAGVILNSNNGVNTVTIKSLGADGSFVIENPNGTERLRITDTGRLGIGDSHPNFQMTVASVSASSYINLISGGGNAGHIFTAGPREAVIRENIGDGSFVIENPNGTERFRVAANGNVGIGTATPTNPLQMGSGAFVSAGGVWTNASSRTLKDRIADLPLDAALDAFEQLTPVTYVYKASPTEAHVGFIAEDVPQLVATADRKGLAAMDIVAVVTKVVQAQQATIREQQTTIDELKARLARLEAGVRK